MVRIFIYDESVLWILIIILKQFFDYVFVNLGLYTIFKKIFIELSFRQTMAYTYINRNLMLIGISLFVYHAVSYKLDEDAFVFPGKKHISFHQKGMKMLKSYFVRTAIRKCHSFPLFSKMIMVFQFRSQLSSKAHNGFSRQSH